MSTVDYSGQRVRVCSGHRKRAVQGQPIDQPLGLRAEQGDISLVVVTCAVEPSIKAKLEKRAKARKISLSEAGHQALAEWADAHPSK